MPDASLEMLVERLKEKRGDQGIRKIAEQIGISAATLSRVERGNVPDLETFRKICEWLDLDPGVILGFRASTEQGPVVRVHFKKDIAIKPETARALSELILKAQQQMQREEGL
jgi:transcriptional regulator with XRE-family HTH domain